MDEVTALKGLESLSDDGIRIVGSGIEIFGVLIIVTGIAWSTYVHLRRPMPIAAAYRFKSQSAFPFN